MGDRLRINGSCVIDGDELVWRFTASGGPGGQHANKAATRAEVSFDIASSASLTEHQRDQLLRKLGPVARAACDDERSQLRNRSVAQERLLSKLERALFVPKRRRPSKPSRRAAQRRIDDKKRRGQTKQSRSWRPDD